MLIDFLYGISNIQLSLMICGLFVLLGMLGVALSNWLIGKEMAFEHNTAVSAMIRPIPSLFAVLAAFMAIGTVASFHNAKDLVQKEAAIVGVIRHEVELLPGEVAGDIRGALKGYLTAVISTEWPLMKTGRADTSARSYLNDIYAHAGQYQLQTNVQQMALDKIIDHADRLFQIHEERALLAVEALPPAAWLVLVACGLLTIISVLLIKTRSLLIRCVCAVCVSLSVGLIVFLAFAFDRLFRGRISVEPTPLLLQLQDMAYPALLIPGVLPKFTR
jgi:glucan phosphoethanolaminetransferase (alkaline phosphatase superfamily)